MGRPFRAWGFGGVGYPGRCPGLGLRRAFGAKRCEASDAEAQKGRPKVGNETSDASEAEAPKGASQAEPRGNAPGKARAM